MSDPQAKVAPPRARARRILLRVLWILIGALVLGAAEHGSMSLTNRAPGPAGFRRGLLQGALMPAAMPNLIIGRDVPIYTEPNTGLSYKLGYTMGVNGCGAIFFGILFWRLHQWRKRARTPA